MIARISASIYDCVTRILPFHIFRWSEELRLDNGWDNFDNYNDYSSDYDEGLENQFMQRISSVGSVPFGTSKECDEKDALIEYLLSTDCRLFVSEEGSMPFSASDALRLLHAGSNLEDTLMFCRYLDLTGRRFGAFGSLITAVEELQIQAMRQKRDLLFFLSSHDCPLFLTPSPVPVEIEELETEHLQNDDAFDADDPIIIQREDVDQLFKIGMEYGLDIHSTLLDLVADQYTFSNVEQLMLRIEEIASSYSKKIEKVTPKDRQLVIDFLFDPHVRILDTSLYSSPVEAPTDPDHEVLGYQDSKWELPSPCKFPLLTDRQVNELVIAGNSLEESLRTMNFFNITCQKFPDIRALAQGIRLNQRQLILHRKLLYTYLSSLRGRSLLKFQERVIEMGTVDELLLEGEARECTRDILVVFGTKIYITRVA